MGGVFVLVRCLIGGFLELCVGLAVLIVIAGGGRRDGLVGGCVRAGDGRLIRCDIHGCGAGNRCGRGDSGTGGGP